MTTAKIAALSKCDGTGITAGLAEHYASRLGSGFMAVVELMADERTTDAEGEESVKLVIGSIEPATDRAMSKHLRDVAAGLYRARDPRPTLLGETEPSLEEIAREFRDTIPEGTSVSINGGPEIQGTGKRS